MPRRTPRPYVSESPVNLVVVVVLFGVIFGEEI